MKNKETRFNDEIGVYRVTEESNPASSDQVIEEIARRLSSDIEGCPLYSATWKTCAFDQLLEMLDDYASVNLSIVKAHEQCLRTSWSKDAVKKALAKCGDQSQCVVEEELNDGSINVS